MVMNRFYIVYKPREANDKVCSTTWNSYFTSWNAVFD